MKKIIIVLLLGSTFHNTAFAEHPGLGENAKPECVRVSQVTSQGDKAPGNISTSEQEKAKSKSKSK